MVYRASGTHGLFDLYSLGADGVDSGGDGDDISNWAFVRDGYYYKATWPLGRYTIGATVFLVLAVVIALRRFSWSARAVAGVVVLGVGLLVGCELLLHPGVVPSRNSPLQTVQLVCVAELLIAIMASWVYVLRSPRSSALTRVVLGSLALACLPAVPCCALAFWLADSPLGRRLGGELVVAPPPIAAVGSAFLLCFLGALWWRLRRANEEDHPVTSKTD